MRKNDMFLRDSGSHCAPLASTLHRDMRCRAGTARHAWWWGYRVFGPGEFAVKRYRLTIVVWMTLLGCCAAVHAVEPLQPIFVPKAVVGKFWHEQYKRLIVHWIPHCIEQMEPGGRGQELLNMINAGKALRDEPHGKFTGLVFADAYIYNTIEAMCLALEIDPAGDPEIADAQALLRKKLDAWIPIVLAAQCDDGYIHSYHILNDVPRYSNIDHHEFYTQGYFIEAGVAHYRMTGGKDRRLFDAARRCADHLCDTFGPPPKRLWIYGHEGMGIALCRLATLVDEIEGPGAGDKYVTLAKYLIDHRADIPRYRSPYRQSHVPVPEMSEAVGHAVRGTYLYAAVTELAMQTGDDGYAAAAERLWRSAIDRKAYITGGVGASHAGEAFGPDYFLPNDGYCESCAACGMVFWSHRMHAKEHDARYIDVQERTLYNAILGAVDLAGENFFYQNPLASEQMRYPWHGCPCCVGNIPRTLLALKDRTYSCNAAGDKLFINHYLDSRMPLRLSDGTQLVVEQQTNYPLDGVIRIVFHLEAPKTAAVCLRIPDRTESALYTAMPDLSGKFELTVDGETVDAPTENGYAVLERTWHDGDTITLELPIDVQRVYADPRVEADRGRVALIRGPIVYNVENADHPCDVRALVLPRDAAITATWQPELLGGVVTLRAEAFCRGLDGSVKPVDLFAVPNYVRLNRPGWSQVWIVESPEKVPLADELPMPIERPELDARTIDRVRIGDPESERAHGLKGEKTGSGTFRNRNWRHAVDGGWFEFRLKVDPEAENRLLCTYWGSDGGNRLFDVLIDGKVLLRRRLEHNKPGKFFDVEVPIPKEATSGKHQVTVRFQGVQNAWAGGVFDLRIVRP